MAPNNNDYKFYASTTSATTAADTLIEEEKKVDSGGGNCSNFCYNNHDMKACAYADAKLPATTTTTSGMPPSNGQKEPQSLASYAQSSPRPSSCSSPYLASFTSGGKRKLLPTQTGEAPTMVDTTEAGLELLFAASLIQQKDESDKQKQQLAAAAAAQKVPGTKALSSCSENDESAAGEDSPLHSSLGGGGGGGADLQLVGETSTDRVQQQVVEPSDRDVLCGRGGFINKHVGNIVYRKVVDYNKAVYKQVPKRHRILVSQSIVQTIEKHGGRFLQPVSGQGRKNQRWMCIQFRRAVQKTSQALREPTTSTSGESENPADANTDPGVVGEHEAGETSKSEN